MLGFGSHHRRYLCYRFWWACWKQQPTVVKHGTASGGRGVVAMICHDVWTSSLVTLNTSPDQGHNQSYQLWNQATASINTLHYCQDSGLSFLHCSKCRTWMNCVGQQSLNLTLVKFDMELNYRTLDAGRWTQ